MTVQQCRDKMVVVNNQLEVNALKITEFSIKRSAGMTMIVMLFIVLGLVGYSRIGSDMFPRTDVPFVTVVSTYPGAGAQEIENQVVDPIEEAVSSISGVKRVTSSASEGMTFTTLEFRMGTDINIAASDTQKAIDAILYKLPRDMDKPIVEKVDLNAEPVMTLAVSSDFPLTETYRLAKDKIQQRLATLPGVGKITIQGGREREIQVLVDKSKLEGYGLSINSVVNRLKLENYNIPGGRLTEPETEYTVRVLGQYSTLDEIRSVRIPLPTGGTVALGDVAEVMDSFKEVRQYNKLDGRNAVGLLVQKQSDASIVDTAQAVRQEVEQLRKTLPKGVNIVIPVDSSTFITSSLDDTKRSLLEGVLMTGLVLLFFLREWRSLLIVMLAIPTSIISTFMMMYFFGYSFNILSLTALSVCVGILVDDSIVVLENINRHLKMGKNPIQAALDGRSEIGMAAIAITLSDVVIFGPIAFMQGMVGQMFRQFGMTVVFATLFSLIISFTLTPMLASKLFRQEGGGETTSSGTFWKFLNSRLIPLGDWVVAFYRKLMVLALRHRWKVVGTVFLGFILSISLFAMGLIGSGFMSVPDRGLFYVTMELAPGTSLERTGKTFEELEALLHQVPEVDHIYSTMGSGGGDYSSKSGSHIGKLTVILKPKAERTRTVWEVADQVRTWKKEFPRPVHECDTG
ncbi:MAG TPA: efflux RND transporter permease subunit [Bacillota bacterium]|nr:efflux RND transporter permease subunit [Bacillota bacterium]